MIVFSLDGHLASAENLAASLSSNLLNDEYRSLPIDDITLHVRHDSAELEGLMTKQLKNYLLQTNVEEKNNSINQLWIECRNTVMSELRSNTLFLVKESSGSLASTSASYYFQPVVDNWKYQGDFLLCEGRLEMQKPVWKFKFAIHEDYLTELPEHTIKHLSSIVEYEGEGVINLKTGEVY